MGQNSAAIVTLGSAIGVFRKVDSNTSAIGDVVELPLIKTSNLADTNNTSDVPAESGDTFITSTSVTSTWDITLMQQDTATLQLGASLRNQYITLVKENSVVDIDGKHQYIVAPRCFVPGNTTINPLSGEVPFQVRPTPVLVDTTVDLSLYANDKFKETLTGDVIVPQGATHIIVELP